MYKITYSNFNNLKQTGGAKSENIKLISEIITSDIPSYFECLITRALFYDPVVASDGSTYERESITTLISTSRNPLSPKTRDPLKKDLYNNISLKEAIVNYIIEKSNGDSKWTYEYELKLRPELPSIIFDFFIMVNGTPTQCITFDTLLFNLDTVTIEDIKADIFKNKNNNEILKQLNDDGDSNFSYAIQDRFITDASKAIFDFINIEENKNYIRSLIRNFKNIKIRSDDDIMDAVRDWLENANLAEQNYGHISTWDVSSVTDMGGMFSEASSFNQPLDSWDVSSVTNMNGMFQGASTFNQPLDSWDVSSVTDMSDMFCEAYKFNQPLDSWDVSQVTNMNSMFDGATSFNQPLNLWDVSSVTNMWNVFNVASSFNQPLDSWDVSKVTSMRYMFSGASSFNQPLASWDVSKVTDMEGMFENAMSFNQPLDLWNVSSVKRMSRMFFNASSFNQSLDTHTVTRYDGSTYIAWDVSSVTDMRRMFWGASSFIQPLGSWVVSSNTEIENIFKHSPIKYEDIPWAASQMDLLIKLKLKR